MATKTEKDKKIEFLQEENKALKRRNRLVDWIKNLDKKKRILIALYLVALVLGAAVIFGASFLKVSLPESITPEEYELMLSEVKDRSWKVGKAYREELKKHTHGTADGNAYTKREEDALYLKLYGTMDNTYCFTYRDGEVLGFVDSLPATLQYSESVLKTGRALTLLLGEDKITFYEVK